MGELEGRVALVTGASRGIGRAIARRFAAEGAAVVLVASRLGAHGPLAGTLEEAVSELQAAGAKAAALAADLAKPEAREGLLERASQAFGPPDVLVNNAAAAHMKLPSVATTRERQLMWELNLQAPIDLAQQALPGMRAAGAGWILNITSASARPTQLPYRSGRDAALSVGPYGSTKAALDRYTDALACELAPERIFVNALAPVAIVMTQGADWVRDIARANPDMVEPVEVMAEAALELCSARHVGRVVTSRELLHEIARPVRSLDGARVLGDGLLAADPETTA